VVLPLFFLNKIQYFPPHKALQVIIYVLLLARYFCRVILVPFSGGELLLTRCKIWYAKIIIEVSLLIILTTLEPQYSNIYLTGCNFTQFTYIWKLLTCFGWYLHPSSGAHTTVSTASGICHTVTATCRYRRGDFISGNCSTCFGWYLHPSSGAHTTVSTASGVCHTITATCHYHGRVGTTLP